jgi:hypothetical protein
MTAIYSQKSNVSNNMGNKAIEVHLIKLLTSEVLLEIQRQNAPLQPIQSLDLIFSIVNDLEGYLIDSNYFHFKRCDEITAKELEDLPPIELKKFKRSKSHLEKGAHLLQEFKSALLALRDFYIVLSEKYIELQSTSQQQIDVLRKDETEWMNMYYQLLQKVKNNGGAKI